MSDQELDNLFKNKLQALEKQPSSKSWPEIQAKMVRKKRKHTGHYYGIAATVALFVTCFFLLQYNGEWRMGNGEQLAVGKRQSAKGEGQRAKGKGQTGDEQGIENEESRMGNGEQSAKGKGQLAEGNSIANDGDRSARHQKPVASGQSAKGSRQREKGMENGEQSAKGKGQMAKGEGRRAKGEGQKAKDNATDNEQRTINNEQFASDQKPVTSNQRRDETSRTLIFDIEDFDAARTVAHVDERPEQQKAPLKKVLDFAKNLQVSGGIGELREAKNEFFALNFIKKENNNSN